MSLSLVEEGAVADSCWGADHKVVKEDLEILPSDGKAINEWLRGVSLARSLQSDGLTRSFRSKNALAPVASGSRRSGLRRFERTS